MDFEIARELVEQAKACDVHINKMFEIIEKVEDQDERKKLTRKCCEVLGVIYSEILRPIEIEYPSLNPDDPLK